METMTFVFLTALALKWTSLQGEWLHWKPYSKIGIVECFHFRLNLFLVTMAACCCILSCRDIFVFVALVNRVVINNISLGKSVFLSEFKTRLENVGKKLRRCKNSSHFRGKYHWRFKSGKSVHLCGGGEGSGRERWDFKVLFTFGVKGMRKRRHWQKGIESFHCLCFLWRVSVKPKETFCIHILSVCILPLMTIGTRKGENEMQKQRYCFFEVKSRFLILGWFVTVLVRYSYCVEINVKVNPRFSVRSPSMWQDTYQRVLLIPLRVWGLKRVTCAAGVSSLSRVERPARRPAAPVCFPRGKSVSASSGSLRFRPQAT